MFFWNRGCHGRIVAQRSHESVCIVSVHVTRIAHVPAALRNALIAEAPAIAQRRRDDATKKRAAAEALLVEANALDYAANLIDMKLAAMVTT